MASLMEPLYRKAQTSLGGGVDSSNADSRVIRYIMSDPSVARDKHRILSGAWQLDNFKKNPVFCWCHLTDEPPIGSVIDIGEGGGKLKGAVQYASREQYPFADTIFQLVRGGFLNAVSVSWLPLEYERSNDRSRPGGIDFSQVELLEISQVSVPSLPTALNGAPEPGIYIAPFAKWAEHRLDMKEFRAMPDKRLQAVRRAASAAISVPVLDVRVPFRGLTEATIARWATTVALALPGQVNEGIAARWLRAQAIACSVKLDGTAVARWLEAKTYLFRCQIEDEAARRK